MHPAWVEISALCFCAKPKRQTSFADRVQTGTIMQGEILLEKVCPPRQCSSSVANMLTVLSASVSLLCNWFTNQFQPDLRVSRCDMGRYCMRGLLTIYRVAPGERA